jgi:hypothetical protein
MITQIILAVAMLAALFILFLVLSKTVGSIDNHLYKLEYLLRKECDIKLETLEVKYKIKAADKKFNEMYDLRHHEEAAEEGHKDKDKEGDKGKAAEGGGNG